MLLSSFSLLRFDLTLRISKSLPKLYVASCQLHRRAIDNTDADCILSAKQLYVQIAEYLIEQSGTSGFCPFSSCHVLLEADLNIQRISASELLNLVISGLD